MSENLDQLDQHEKLDGQTQSNGVAVASLVTGIVSIVLCWTPLVGLVCGILGIVFYSKTRKGIEEGTVPANSKGMSVGGLVTGIIGLVFSFFYNIFWVIWIFALATIANY